MGHLHVVLAHGAVFGEHHLDHIAGQDADQHLAVHAGRGGLGGLAALLGVLFLFAFLGGLVLGFLQRGGSRGLLVPAAARLARHARRARLLTLGFGGERQRVRRRHHQKRTPHPRARRPAGPSASPSACSAAGRAGLRRRERERGLRGASSPVAADSCPDSAPAGSSSTAGADSAKASAGASAATGSSRMGVSPASGAAASTAASPSAGRRRPRPLRRERRRFAGAAASPSAVSEASAAADSSGEATAGTAAGSDTAGTADATASAGRTEAATAGNLNGMFGQHGLFRLLRLHRRLNRLFRLLGLFPGCFRRRLLRRGAFPCGSLGRRRGRHGLFLHGLRRHGVLRSGKFQRGLLHGRLLAARAAGLLFGSGLGRGFNGIRSGGHGLFGRSRLFRRGCDLFRIGHMFPQKTKSIGVPSGWRGRPQKSRARTRRSLGVSEGAPCIRASPGESLSGEYGRRARPQDAGFQKNFSGGDKCPCARTGQRSGRGKRRSGRTGQSSM